MSLFNLFKKNSSKSGFNVNHIDEVSITMMFIKNMINADGVEKEEEKEAFNSYLLNCGFTEPKQLQDAVKRAVYLGDNQSEFDLIITRLSDIQKLNIINELIRVIGVDGEVSDAELDQLFGVSLLLKISDVEVKSLVEKMKESVKNTNKTIRKNKLTYNTQLYRLEEELRDKTKISKELGDEAGLEDIWIVDYFEWFQIIKKRTNLPTQKKDDQAKIRMIDGHYQEYHYRMLDNDDSDKTKFIFMRAVSFYFIYQKIKEFDITNLSSEELSNYDNLLFHSMTSLYGAIKFAILDMNKGEELLEQYEIDYEIKFINSTVEKDNKEVIEKSIKTFPHSFLTSINTFLIKNAETIIKDKKNTRYNAVIDLINTIYPNPSSDFLEIESVDINNPKFYEYSFDDEQKELFSISFGTLILSANTFQFEDYSKFLLNFYKSTELEIPEILSEYIDIITIKCSNCNNEISDTDKFCGKCGFEQSSNRKTNNNSEFIVEVESQLSSEENPNKYLFEWARGLNEGKKGENIPLEKIDEMIEEELLTESQLKKVLKKINLNDSHMDKSFLAMAYGAFITIDIDYMANILNESENDKFNRWSDLEQYHAIYTHVFNYINKEYNPHHNG